MRLVFTTIANSTPITGIAVDASYLISKLSMTPGVQNTQNTRNNKIWKMTNPWRNGRTGPYRLLEVNGSVNYIISAFFWDTITNSNLDMYKIVSPFSEKLSLEQLSHGSLIAFQA